MAKNRSNPRKTATIILASLGVGIAIILIPIVLAVILGLLFPNSDAYLLTGFSFYSFGSIAMIGVLVLILIVISVKSKEKGVIKKFCRDYKAFVVLIAVPLVIIEIALVAGGFTYLRDIKAGSQEAIMTDAVVERRSSGKSGHSTYLVGYINGEKTELELTRDAYDAVERGESYERLKIGYYQAIAEVFEIEVYIE